MNWVIHVEVDPWTQGFLWGLLASAFGRLVVAVLVAIWQPFRKELALRKTAKPRTPKTWRVDDD